MSTSPVSQAVSLPLRKIFAEASDVLTAVCPCWMASPLSVCQLLGSNTTFDYVVFDEASQILPEDAIPSIIRARHVIVAGDNKQLPPTTFFAASDEDTEEQETTTCSWGLRPVGTDPVAWGYKLMSAMSG